MILWKMWSRGIRILSRACKGSGNFQQFWARRLHGAGDDSRPSGYFPAVSHPNKPEASSWLFYSAAHHSE